MVPEHAVSVQDEQLRGIAHGESPARADAAGVEPLFRLNEFVGLSLDHVDRSSDPTDGVGLLLVQYRLKPADETWLVELHQGTNKDRVSGHLFTSWRERSAGRQAAYIKLVPTAAFRSPARHFDAVMSLM